MSELENKSTTGEHMTRTSQAEVSHRLALWLNKNELAEGTVEVAIDGAQGNSLRVEPMT